MCENTHVHVHTTHTHTPKLQMCSSAAQASMMKIMTHLEANGSKKYFKATFTGLAHWYSKDQNIYT